MLKINEYFEGNVKSISFNTPDLPATVGVMAMGEYTFGTSQKEYMTVISGHLEVRQENNEDWMTCKSGDSFTVEAGNKFELKVATDTAYLCKYE